MIAIIYWVIVASILIIVVLVSGACICEIDRVWRLQREFLDEWKKKKDSK